MLIFRQKKSTENGHFLVATPLFSVLYVFVGMTGLEPATTRPPDAYANQLRHIPNT